jgi:hypothetical protein
MARGQVNLVLNPSFEDSIMCPGTNNQIYLAKHWSSCPDSAGFSNCDPDYLHACDSGISTCGIPWGGGGFQYAHTGNGMAQNIMFNDSSDIQDVNYTQGRLYKFLTAGHNYCVGFWVNLCDVSMYAISNIGAYLDNGMIDNNTNCDIPLPMYTPQIINTLGIISDTQHWVKIEGSFTANGTEKFITIGNFNSIYNTTKITVPPLYTSGGGNNIAMYLIDDVSVIESNTTANAGNDTVVSVSHETGVVDCAFVGLHELGWDCTWQQIYPAPTTVIGHGAGIWVHPHPGTNVYVVSMTLCGITTTDTVRVYAWGAGVTPIGYTPKYTVYPNPVKEEVHINNVFENQSYRILSVIGSVIQQGKLKKGDNIVSIVSLQTGVYLLEIISKEGEKVVQKMIKER